ncbi:MAG: T9SS type A sorting domain-containing protein [Bacteroidetes bacterium]|nr:T9SS type A sorting domain-containing protein [Bacteroidota bacterium]
MKKTLLLTHLFVLISIAGFTQTNRFWTANYESPSAIKKYKTVERLSFPKEFKLFNLNLAAMKQELFTVADNRLRHTTVITLPNVDGQMEEFEIVEASNFEPALQERFPDIRAFSGRGLTDKTAMLKLSISPEGIQTMIFRTGKENEFIEVYSDDHLTYAVFKSHRNPGQLPWTCSTVETKMANGLNNEIGKTGITARSGGDLKTMRLAQSVTAEYSNYFGATSASQVSLVLAAVNNTLTRCNGVYEKDLALHLNLIVSTTNVFYYNASSDPYSAAATGANGAWNSELQSTLTSVIGDANYDIGHLFGASGGGGNAGCIGCVCTNGSKGSGFTSPADGIPSGDNFDIDYVVHEVGHQLGANHTFSFSLEGTGVNKEVGSGITIMGYAGITSQDVAPHSIDIYHEASIAQIQSNLASKSCPVTTSISATNATPVVAAVSNYTIPISTPFALTGSATDANATDVLTYCWEQNDNSSVSGASSVASATKASGPNWISFSPTTSPTRYFPKLATILAGGLISGPLTGGDAGANTEALSSVSRTLNFRLTVRDNAPYSSTAPVSVGQTQFTDMVVTVTNTSGPFQVTSPNTAVSWAGNSSQTITWNVASTTGAPVSCANVKISLSTDGGQTFPTVLIASTTNDGSEVVTIPNTPTTTARIKVEAVGNIFFDISNTNFTITAAASGLTTITTSAVSPVTYCTGTAVSVPFTTNAAANAGNVFTAQLSNAAGSFASPVSIGTLTSTAAGTISATIPANATAGTGYRIRVVSSNPVVTGSDNGANITINAQPVASVLTAIGSTTFCQGGNVVINGNTSGGTWSVGGGTTTSLTATASGDYYTTTTNGCGSITSNHIAVTVNSLPAAVITASGATTFCQGGSVTLSANTGVGLTYQWFVNGSLISGAASSSIPAVTTGTYSATVTNANGCSANSNVISVTVNPLPTATITAAGPVTFCTGGSVVLNANTGSGLTYQWKQNTSNISGATASSYTATTAGSYTVVVTNANGCSATSLATVVSVQSNSIASVSIAASPAGAICQNTNVVFTATPVSGGANPIYSWSVNGSTISSGTNPVFGSTTLVNGDVVNCSMLSNLGGCVVNNPATSNSVVMTVNPLPTVSFSGLASTYAVNAASVTLTGSPAGGTFSGPGISGNTFSPAAAGAGGPYNIIYTYTNANGCTNSNTQQTTVTGTCTIPARPGTITTVGGSAKVCPGDVKTYTIVAVSGATSYTWSAPAGAVVTGGQGTTAATITYTTGFTAGDSLRVTANNTCGSSVARALKINRNANASTPSAITGSAFGVCNSSNVAYTVTPVSGVSYAWTWSVANASIASGQGTNAITSNFLSAFVTGKLSVVATNACGSSSARALTVYARPAVPGTITGSTTACANQSGLPYSIAPVPNAATYTWYGPSGSHISDGTTTSASSNLTTTATNVTVNFGTTAGQVRVKGNNACASGGVASLTVAFTCKGNVSTIPSTEYTDVESVFPNPSNGNFKLNIGGNVTVTTTAKVEIINQFGQVVYQGNHQTSNGMIDLKLSDKLANGIYMVSYVVNAQKVTKKLLISK